MIFETLELNANGTVTATAQGHPTEVMDAFHSIAAQLLGSRGPWRITEVSGVVGDGQPRESEMTWTLKAKLKKLEGV